MAKSLRSQVAPKINGHKPAAAAKPAAPRNGKASSGKDPFLGDDFAEDAFEEFSPVVEEVADEVEVADEHGDDTVDATDDPIRMYLMQMGEIPLLNRAEEIASA